MSKRYKTLTNKLFAIIFSMFCTTTLAQITNVTDQPDSIYKVNHVKARRDYNPNGSLNATNFFDKKGHLIRTKYERWSSGEQLTSHNVYNEAGRLINKIDTILNQETPRNDLKEEERNLLNFFLKKPVVKVSRYTINYIGSIVTTTQYNYDSTFYLVDSAFNNLRVKINYLYYRGELKERNVTEFSNNGYAKHTYGWRMMMDKKETWDTSFEYQFIDNQVITYSIIEKSKSVQPPVKLLYNDKGLLIQIGNISLFRFEYDYY